jgi:DNA-binding response OmpR family regulator
MHEAGSSADPVHQPHLLIAEDDVPLAHFLKRGLQADRCAVDVVHDGEAAFQAARASQYDLLILDLNLPKLDGLALLRQLRPAMPSLPILVLTGRSRLEDRLMALNDGADDCMSKPFSFHELTARAHALLRRNGGSSARCMQVGDPLLDRNVREVRNVMERACILAQPQGEIRPEHIVI